MDLRIDTSDLANVPHIDQYFGLWAMHSEQFLALSQFAATLNVQLHMAGSQPAQAVSAASDNAQFEDGIAVVKLEGTLMKHVSSFSHGTSTLQARRQLRAATADADVAAIMLHVKDSPGGTVAGTMELGDDIRRASQAKPTVAFIEDLGASAAFWAASQASQVFANAPAKVGSIGTFGVVSDMSALAAKEGIKVHVISSGGLKGMGVSGTEITGEQLQELQRIVSQTNDFFIQAVMRGRGMTQRQVEQLADGRVHLAADAVDLGMIDGVSTFEDTLQQLAARQLQKRRTIKMSEPATVKQIKAECVGITSEFALELLERELPIGKCKDEWMAHQALLLEEREKEVAQAKAEAERAVKQPSEAQAVGVDDLEEVVDSRQWDGCARDEWDRKIDEQVARKVPRSKAVSIVNRKNPGLREAMLAEANE